jgi:hypothetical protein
MGAEGLKEPRELIVVSGFGAGQAGWAQARLPEPMATLRFTLPLIGPGATAAASRLGIEIKTRRGCCSLLRGGQNCLGKPRGSGNTSDWQQQQTPVGRGGRGQFLVSRVFSPLSCEWPDVHYTHPYPYALHSTHTHTHTLVTVAHFYIALFSHEQIYKPRQGPTSQPAPPQRCPAIQSVVIQ